MDFISRLPDRGSGYSCCSALSGFESLATDLRWLRNSHFSAESVRFATLRQGASYPRLLRMGGGWTNRCQTAPLSNCIVRPSGEYSAPSFQYCAQM